MSGMNNVSFANFAATPDVFKSIALAHIYAWVYFGRRHMEKKLFIVETFFTVTNIPRGVLSLF